MDWKLQTEEELVEEFLDDEKYDGSKSEDGDDND